VYLAISCQQRICCSIETSSDSAILISFSIGLISNFNNSSTAASLLWATQQTEPLDSLPPGQKALLLPLS